MKYNNLRWGILSLAFILPALASAQVFKPLVGIPGISDPNASFNDYINTLYLISISIAALIAVIKIIIAGLKYMLSDSIGSKSGAKSDIQGALIGLAVIAAAVLILNTINPELTKSNLITSKASTQTSPAPAAPVTGAPLPPAIKADTSSACTKSTDADGSVSYDCKALESACRAGGGTVITPIFSLASKSYCSYGNTIPIACGEELNDATQQMETDCTKAEADCISKKGSPTVDGGQVQCFIPTKT